MKKKCADRTLVDAVSEQYLTGVKNALALGDNPDATDQHGRSALAIACLNDDLGLVDALLDNGASIDIDTKNESLSPYFVAASRIKSAVFDRIFEFLLSNGADKDFLLSELIEWGIRSKRLRALKYALEKGASASHLFDADGVVKLLTPLCLAAQTNFAEATETLIHAGADINKVSLFNRKPIHFAACANTPDSLKVLIDHGADIESRTASRRCLAPLHEAADSGSDQCVSFLLSIGADANSLSANNESPLHLAAENEHLSTVRLLCEGGADPNIQDIEGQTPLHKLDWDSWRHDVAEECIIELLKHGANPKISDNQGEIPLDNFAGDGRNRALSFYESLAIKKEIGDAKDSRSDFSIGI